MSGGVFKKSRERETRVEEKETERQLRVAEGTTKQSPG